MARMRYIELTQGQRAIVDDEDYDSLMKHSWHASWNRDTQSYYAKRGTLIEGRASTQFMHRYILGLVDPSIQGDHLNHDTLDNRKDNLRVASAYQSAANKRPYRGSTSKYKGVSWYKRSNKWYAQIKVNNKVTNLGYFDTEIEAALAYDAAAIKFHKQFAWLNSNNFSEVATALRNREEGENLIV